MSSHHSDDPSHESYKDSDIPMALEGDRDTFKALFAGTLAHARVYGYSVCKGVLDQTEKESFVT
jgi:hypothetical protein